MTDTQVLGLELLAGAETICIAGLQLDPGDPEVARLLAIAPNAALTVIPRDPTNALFAARAITADVLILAEDARKLTAVALLSRANRVLLYKGGRLTPITTAGFLRDRAPVVSATHAIRRTLEATRYASVEPVHAQRFYVVSCGRNAGPAATKCLDSVFTQRYPADRIEHLYVDDDSTDDTRTHIHAWLACHPAHRVTYVANAQRVGGTANTLRAFRDAPIGSIVVELNGDDWLFDEGVLAHLDKIYADPSAWMTYNSCTFVDGRLRPLNRPYPSDTIAAGTYRDADWHAGALRTFRAELFTHVEDEELIDPATGTWWESADDMVIFLALLEMSGEHARHVDRPTYVYNHRAESEDVRDLFGGRLRGERIRAQTPHTLLGRLEPKPSTDTGPLVSVLMPVYEAGPYVEIAIRSVLDQSYEHLELIVVDDGSTDDSGAIIDRLATEDGRITVLKQPNAGLVVSLNRALEHARGPLLARMDADDTCRKDRVERQVRFLAANTDVGAVGSWVDRIDEVGRRLMPSWETPASAGVISWFLFFENCLPHGSVMMRRTALDRVGPYDAEARHAEDYDLWIRLDGVTDLANLPEPLMSLRVHDGRVGVRHNDTQEQTAMRLMTSRWARALRRDVPVEVIADLYSLHRRRFARSANDPQALLDTLLELWRVSGSARRLGESERAEIDYDLAKKLANLAKWTAPTHPITAARAVAAAAQLGPDRLAKLAIRGWRST